LAIMGSLGLVYQTRSWGILERLRQRVANPYAIRKKGLFLRSYR
jgi:hypothetical protein